MLKRSHIVSEEKHGRLAWEEGTLTPSEDQQSIPIPKTYF